MTIRHVAAPWAALLLVVGPALAEGPAVPPGDRTPLLRLEAGGPTSFVTALAFSPDGRTLYAAGWDKVVRVWHLNDRGRFVPGPRSYRVPVGPGLAGALNAVAVSPDGVWLAAGGLGVYRGSAGFAQFGMVVPDLGALSPEMREDEGLIHVFDTRTGAVRLLRGHRGAVLSLAFGPPRPGKAPLLVSAARERDEDTGRYGGGVRAWDVETGQTVAVLGAKLPDPPARPDLAAWSSAAGVLQVALGWGDGRFRVWDVAGGDLHEAADTRYDPLVYLPGRDRVLTAAFGAEAVRLRPWQVPPGEAPRAAPLPAVSRAEVVPRALGLASSTGDGRPDLAAVVTVRTAPPALAYGLQLLSLAADDFGALKGEVPLLWRGSARQPALAAAPGGEYVAVAGSDGQEVLVYRIRDVLAGTPRVDVLHSAGANIHLAAFVRRGRDVGLLLDERGRKPPGAAPLPPGEGDLVLDFGKRTLTADITGWKADAPAAGAWTAKADWDSTSITVSDGQKSWRVPLPKDNTLSDFALLPAAAGRPAILALATHEKGMPVLALYDGATGELFRQYTGHTGRILCLAFAADGRLLVSAAEDQTVCVWSLANLDTILGQHGLLAGVAVTTGPGGAVVIGRVDDASLARGKLRARDVIDGLVEGGRLRPLATPRDFYAAIDRIAPRQEVTLRVAGRDVTLPVGQGVDQRNPLLSLFVTHAARAEDREWIGWSPVGPYEASDPKAERQIGWHFNTGDPAQPVRFAAANQYHDLFYRPGVLARMVERGKLEDLPPAPRRRPKMTLGVEDGGRFAEPDGRRERLVRHDRVLLRVRLTGAPPESLEAATWRLDDGPEQPINLAAAVGQLLSAPLHLGRGAHRITVTARPREPETQDVAAAEVVVRYQPAAPSLVYAGERQLAVKDADFPLRVTLRPGVAGEPVLLQWSQQVKDQTVTNDTQDIVPGPAEARAVEKRFRLRPGVNRLEVSAVNRDAPKADADLETDRLAVAVTLIEKAPPPRITLEGVADAGGGRPRAVGPDQTIRVRVPRVRLLGRIEAREGLVTAEWRRGDAGPATPLAGFERGRKELDVREEIPLQPGAQTVHFHARTDTSDEADTVVTLDYQPPVPTARITAPADSLEEYGEEETKAVTLTARLDLPEPLQRFRTTLLVEGKEPARPPRLQVDEKAGTVTAVVALHPGTNRLQVRCSNEWGAVSTSEVAEVRYLRPPHVVKLTAPKESKEPVITLEAQVRSLLPLLAESVKVEVNGKDRRVMATVPAEQPAPGTWTVRVKGVTLEAAERGGATENAVRFRLANAEGECREPGAATVVYRPEQPPPQVTILEPHQDTTVTAPEVKIRFRVQSASPLRQVQAGRDGGTPVRVDTSGAKLQAKGSHELTAEAVISLRPGDNSVRVAATNAGGAERSQAVQVTYVYRPVRLLLDELGPADRQGPTTAPEELPGGRLRFAAATSARVRLRGRVVWDGTGDPRLGEARSVRVYVNGFQQLPRVLRPAAGNGRERRFEVELVLTRDRDNEVELALPGLAVGEDARARFTVDCRKPDPAQRLHLLLVSPRQQDGAALRARFLDALGATGSAGQLRSPVFDPVTVYGPQVGFYARREYVNSELLKIQTAILELAAAGQPSTDVVVVYYQGREAVKAKGHFFEAGADDDRLAISADDLAGFFGDTPGAHVLLLDVDRAAQDGTDKVARWPALYPDTAASVAVLRYAWLGGGGAPHDVRLVKALEDALHGAARLVDVTKVVRQVAVNSPDYDKTLKFSEYVPDELAGMALGGR
jgi:WD40 repeat protein